MVTLDVIRELFADLPGVEEGFSYGSRAFKVKKKLLARIHQKEDALVVKTDFDAREKLLQANSVAYYITDPYTNPPALLVRLPTVQRDELHELLIKAWRKEAPKRLVEEFDSK